VSEEKKLKPLTEMQLMFVTAFAGSQTQAARDAGFSNPKIAGSKLMHLPHVRAAVEAKQKAVIETVGVEAGLVIAQTITKDMLAQRAWDIARMPPDNNGMFTCQVNSLKFLGELLKYTGEGGSGGVTIVNQPQVYQSQWVRDGNAQPAIEAGSQ
jgi:hypothetical protein